MIELETLPKGWTIANFNECCENISLNGIKVKQKQYLASGKFPVIDQGRELIGGYFNDDLLVVPNEPPYIVFGDHTKVKKFVTFKFIAGADGVKVLKPYDFILPKLFYYFIHAVKMPDKGYARHYQFLASEKFPIPPLNEQKRILAKLEQLLTDLDKGIEYLETTKQQLKVYRQAVLKWAFEGKLTNEENIRWGKLKEVVHDVEYGSATKSLKTGKIPVLRMGNIQNGKFVWNDLVFTSNEAEIKKYLLERDDVLFNRTNSPEWVGKTAIYRGERPAIFAGYLIRINRKKELLEPNYLNYYLNSQMAKNHGNKVKSFGVNQSNINGTKLKQYPFPITQIESQKRIIKEIEFRLSVCDKIEETIANSLQQAEALRLSIIKKAFEGKLVPQDPNDEPAEKLLERIRAAKRKGKPEKKEKVKAPKKKILVNG
jgi:type I restriction enzyme S subunit